LTVSVQADAISCNGGTTTVVANVEGGTTPYTYLWSNTETTSSVSDAVAGDYSVTITDANGCTANATTTVTEPEPVDLITEETVNFCDGAVVTLSLAVDNATNIVWNNDENSNASTLEINEAGTYTVAADVEGCHYTDQIVAVVEEMPTDVLEEQYSYEIFSTDTIIRIAATGDFASYLWSDGSTGNEYVISCDTIDFPYSEEMSLTVTTDLGCEYTQMFTLSIINSTSMVIENEAYSWSLAPNPTDGRFDIIGPEFDKAEVFSQDGRKVCELHSANNDLTYLTPGVYNIKVYAAGTVQVLRVIINR